MEKHKLPNATAVLILGILSIPTCCFYGAGLVFGIIALVLAKKDIQLYKTDPALYDGYSNVNTGRILAIIGIVLSAISLISSIYFISMGEEGMMQWMQQMQEMQKQQQ